MNENQNVFTLNVKRVMYGSTFLLGLSMSNVINISGLSPEKVYAETFIPNITVEDSSHVEPYSADRAIDFDSTNEYSRWYCKGSDKFLIINLKQDYHINRWVVKNLGAVGWDSSSNTKDYKFLASSDKLNWTEIDAVSGNEEDVTDRSVAPFTARYVKLLITGGNQLNNNWASIVEFNVNAVRVSSVSVPPKGTYNLGDVINFTVNFDENVNILGVDSKLNLNIGGTVKQANFNTKTANSITYSYTVESGDMDIDGITIGELLMNTTQISDSLGNAANTKINNVGNTSEVLINGTPKIEIAPVIGGTIQTTPQERAIQNTNVNLIITPNAWMKLKDGTLKYNDGTDHIITGTSFIMPNANVTISGEFERIPLTVTADLADGTTVKSGKNVILTAEDGATIYYTVGTDLSEPADPTTASSSISSGGSISITGAPGETVKVKAYAEKSGVPNSQIATFTYKIQEKQNLEVKGLSVANKVYDGTTFAIIQGTDTAALDSAGILSGFENVSLLGIPSGAFVNKNAGNGKVVTVTGYILTGADADYYKLTYPALSADITQKDTTVTGITAKNKAYDGTKTAQLDISSANLSNLETGDSVSIDLSTASIEFEDANEGTGRKVNVSGIKLSGDAKDNYELTNSSFTLIADISGAVVTQGINSVDVSPLTSQLKQGETVKLAVTVDAVGGANAGVTWKSLDASNKVTVDNSGLVKVAIDAVPGDYYITATSVFDINKSGSAKIEVVTDSILPAVNSVQVTPASVTIEQGGSRPLTATVDAVGGAENGVVWSSNDGTGKVTVTSEGIVNVATDAVVGDYTIKAASKFDGSKVGTAVVSVKSSVTPPVNPPVEPPVLPPTPPVDPPVTPEPEKPTNDETSIKIIKQPSKQTVRKGNTASFSIKVEGTEPFIYQWQKDGTALGDDDNISGANKSKLKIEEAQKSDAGEYSCMVTDGIGNVTTSSAVTLKVTSRATTNANNNSSEQNGNNSDTITISINTYEAASSLNLDKIANALKSEKINTVIVSINKTKAGDGVSENETNPAGGTNPPLLNQEVLTILRSNTNKTLIIKNGDSSIQVKGNSQGEIQFTQNNTAVTGFVTIGNSEYYSNENGIMETGWLQTGENVYYYLNPVTGIKEKGWIKDVNGTWYYLDPTSGIMKTGWLNDNGISYYLKSNGAMATGWLQDVDGKWYYFYPNGAMAKNATIDGYYVDENGVWIM